MLLLESYWFRNMIEKFVKDKSVILNIGSQTQYFRAKQQPFIQENIFNMLDERQCKTIHVDVQKAIGVDEVGDVTDPTFLDRLQKYEPDIVICSNILEHLENRGPFCKSLRYMMKSGCLLFVTGPYEFPYHEDPIDSMFRPTLEELRKEFLDLEYLEGEIVACGKYSDLIWQKLTNDENIFRKLESLFRNIIIIIKGRGKTPVQSYGKISAVCAIFKKP